MRANAESLKNSTLVMEHLSFGFFLSVIHTHTTYRLRRKRIHLKNDKANASGELRKSEVSLGATCALKVSSERE